MENQIKKNKGFSLIELLIAITLLSIIMLMVVQFMSSTSWAVTKTKKNQNIQTEAMEVGSQLTDSFMQATYVRVRPQSADKEIYILNTDMDGDEKKREEAPYGESVLGDLVIDNYPNYLKPGETDRQIILDETNYTLVKEKNLAYPLADDNDQTTVQSLRLLTSNRNSNDPAVPDDLSLKSLYVKPEYIYLQYQTKASNKYVIYYFTGNEVYMDRGDVLAGTDNFADAVNAVNGKANLLTKNMSDCYFSADTEANTLFIDMLFENEKFEGYTYNYVESVILRNTDVLTVPPQQMYKLK